MSLRKALLAPLASFLAVATVAASGRAGAWLPAPGEYYSEISADRFLATTFHDDGGDRERLGYAFEHRTLASYNELGWKKWASVVINLPFESVTARDLLSDRSETGLSDLTLGLRVKLMDGPVALAVQGDWTAPLGYEHDSLGVGAWLGTGRQDVSGEVQLGTPRRYTRGAGPWLGAGQQNFAGQLLLGAPLAKVGFLELAGGYHYQLETPVTDVIARGTVGLWLGPSLLVSGHYAGSIAQVGVQESSAPDSTFDVQAHSVGPEVRYRLDDHLDLFVGSWHTLAGKNVVHQDRYYVGVAMKQTRFNRLQGFLGTRRRP